MHLAAAVAAAARLEFGVRPLLPRGATINMQRSVELAELLENMAIDGDVGTAQNVYTKSHIFLLK